MKVLTRVLLVFICFERIGGGVLARPQASTTPLRFEVASVKPSLANSTGFRGCHGVDEADASTIPLGRCIFRHVSLRSLIQKTHPDLSASYRLVFGIDKQIIGGPDWIGDNFFDLEAEADEPTKTTLDQLQQMLQTLLKERFRLAFHMETRETAGYDMVPAKEGFKLKESAGPLTPAEVTPILRARAHTLFANDLTLDDFAGFLSSMIKTPIVDKTGISGKYNVFLNSAETGDETAASIVTALPEQLGLKLEARKIQFQVIVIDHAEKPSDAGKR